ncbi:Appr-1-p processing protein [Microcystis phage Mae-JY35]
MKIYLRDRNAMLCAEWATRIPSADVEQGDIFARPAEAIVSPANSFGFMDGGIDLAYSQRFGWDVQARLQGIIRDEFDGEILVGQAVTLPTFDEDFPHLICAPTMRIPKIIEDPNAIYLATRAAIRCAVKSGFDSILFPGMGTGCGQVKPEWAAAMMAAGVADGLNPPGYPQSWAEASQRHYGCRP